MEETQSIRTAGQQKLISQVTEQGEEALSVSRVNQKESLILAQDERWRRA
jgi:hypothetical protein